MKVNVKQTKVTANIADMKDKIVIEKDFIFDGKLLPREIYQAIQATDLESFQKGDLVIVSVGNATYTSTKYEVPIEKILKYGKEIKEAK